VAVEADSGPAPPEPTEKDLAAWVAALPEAEKNELLLRVTQEKAPLVHAQLQSRFRRDFGRKSGGKPSAAPKPRTASELRAARVARAEENRCKEAEKRAREKAKREREAAKARAAYLDDLAGREEETWREVDALIAATKPKEYDQAVELLKDLHELAERAGNPARARERIRQIREKHYGKSSFRQRLDRAGLNFPEAEGSDAAKKSVTRTR
jgi:hypothetical protein